MSNAAKRRQKKMEEKEMKRQERNVRNMRKGLDKKSPIRVIKRDYTILDFHNKHQDDPEYVNKKFTMSHNDVHDQYAMVLVTPNNQLEFNTSVRYLEGVPSPIGNYMTAEDIKIYQGLICGRPGGVIRKDYMYHLFGGYGEYQVMMCKLYRGLGGTPFNWQCTNLKERTKIVFDEWLEYVQKEVTLAESPVRYHADKFQYQQEFFENKWDFGYVPKHLI